MFVKLLDKTTNQVVDCKQPEFTSVWFWTQGNGACDCNRFLSFPDVDENQYRKALGLQEDDCLGTRRFLLVDATGDLEGHTKEEVLKLANSGY